MESRCESGSRSYFRSLGRQTVLFFDKGLTMITLEHAAQHFFALFEVPPHADEYRVGTL